MQNWSLRFSDFRLCDCGILTLFLEYPCTSLHLFVNLYMLASIARSWSATFVLTWWSPQWHYPVVAWQHLRIRGSTQVALESLKEFDISEDTAIASITSKCGFSRMIAVQFAEYDCCTTRTAPWFWSCRPRPCESAAVGSLPWFRTVLRSRGDMVGLLGEGCISKT